MPAIFDKQYRLSPGTQVRKEDFGLLFYTMSGPRLFLLPSGDFLDTSFFTGEQDNVPDISSKMLTKLEKSLDQLVKKGVICEFEHN